MATILNEYGYPIDGCEITYGHETVSPECQISKRHYPKSTFYKGASRVDLKQWQPPDYSADDSYLHERDIITARIKDLYRNCEIVRGSTNQFVDYVVGDHFRIESSPCYQLLGWDEDVACDWADRVEKLWRLDTESKNNWIHAGGELTFTELVQSVVRNFRIFGENFSIIYFLDRPDSRPFKTSVGLIDPSRIFTPQNLDESGDIRAGIRRNRFGNPLGYFIHESHPSEMCRKFFERDEDRYIFVRKRNQIGREQIIHSYVKEIPSQSRGVSAFANSIRRLKLLEKYEDATLQTAILQSSVAATIESDYPDVGNVFNAAPDGPQTYCDHYMDQSGKYHDELKFNFEGSNVARLWNGEKFKLHSAQMATTDFARFERSMLTHLARALGTSVHHLTQDFSDTNFSGARAEMLSTYKNIQTNRYQIAEDFAQRVYCAWLEENISSGRIALPNISDPNVAWAFFLENRDAVSNANWYGSIKDEIDRSKQIDAYETELRLGLTSRKAYAAEVKNEDWRDNEKQLIKEERWINEERLANGLEPLSHAEFRDNRELSGTTSETITILPEED